MRSKLVAIGLTSILSAASMAAKAPEPESDLPWAFQGPRGDGYRIELLDVVPAPGTPLPAGVGVTVGVRVRYSLSVAPHGLVILVIEDDKNRVVTDDEEQVSQGVDRGDGEVTLTDSIVVPDDAKELRVFVPLVPTGMEQTEGEITVRYPITH